MGEVGLLGDDAVDLVAVFYDPSQQVRSDYADLEEQTFVLFLVGVKVFYFYIVDGKGIQVLWLVLEDPVVADPCGHASLDSEEPS